jgi:CRP-like cAMP-binding protein
VVAHSDVECYRLDKSSFQDLLHTRPQIAEDVSKVMAARQNRLTEAQLSALSGAAKPATSGELLERIRRFFGLAAPH